MADITLSPLPYNGGTFNTTNQTHDYCLLGNGKILNVLLQINPNYIYAYISNNANIKTGTFTSTVPLMRVVLSGSAAASVGSIRLFKMAANRALMVVNGKGYVLEIQANDDIVTKNATFTTNVLTIGAPTSNANNYGSGASGFGSYWQFFNVRDNVMYVFDRQQNNAFGVIVRKLVYDAVADSFAVTQLVVYNGANSTGGFSCSRFHCQDIPGSTSKLLSVRLHAVTSNSPQFTSAVIVAAWIVTENDVATLLPNNPNDVQVLCPLSTTTILGINSQKTYWTYTGGAWAASMATFASTGGNAPLQAEALDANYFMLFAFNGTDLTGQPQITSRVVRYVDPTFGQTSSATAAGNGITASQIYHVHPDQNFITRDGTDAFFIAGRSGLNNYTPQIKSIYQPGG